MQKVEIIAKRVELQDQFYNNFKAQLGISFHGNTFFSTTESVVLNNAAIFKESIADLLIPENDLKDPVDFSLQFKKRGIEPFKVLEFALPLAKLHSLPQQISVTAKLSNGKQMKLIMEGKISQPKQQSVSFRQNYIISTVSRIQQQRASQVKTVEGQYSSQDEQLKRKEVPFNKLDDQNILTRDFSIQRMNRPRRAQSAGILQASRQSLEKIRTKEARLISQARDKQKIKSVPSWPLPLFFLLAAILGYISL